MLPANFNLDYLDKGIREIVIDINRIPGLHTMTTCEGHVWSDIPLCPTKDGWIHFVKPNELYQNLVIDINAFGYRKGYHFFNILGPVELRENHSLYTIEARFDQHDICADSIFLMMDERSKGDYLKRAQTRKLRILQGWNEIDKIVIDYIKRTINSDYQSLPFI